jgi:hypothetical protein
LAELDRRGSWFDASDVCKSAPGPTHGSASAAVGLGAAVTKPRRDAISGRVVLTAGELRVARFAGLSVTNRGIAQALFVMTKAAWTYLGCGYCVLDVRRRGQFQDALSGRVAASAGDASVAAAHIS